MIIMMTQNQISHINHCTIPINAQTYYSISHMEAKTIKTPLTLCCPHILSFDFPLHFRVKLFGKVDSNCNSNSSPPIPFGISIKGFVPTIPSKYHVFATNNLHISKSTDLSTQFHIVFIILVLYLIKILAPALKCFLLLALGDILFS